MISSVFIVFKNVFSPIYIIIKYLFKLNISCIIHIYFVLLIHFTLYQMYLYDALHFIHQIKRKTYTSFPVCKLFRKSLPFPFTLELVFSFNTLHKVYMHFISLNIY